MNLNRALLCFFYAANIGVKELIAFTPTFQNTLFPTSLKTVGLGPTEDEKKAFETKKKDNDNFLKEEPDHEHFRLSRLSDFDKKCDDWYANILNPSKPTFLGKVSEEALRRINTLVKLEKEPGLEFGDDDWTPYKSNVLTGSPILPSFGLEQYGLPTIRRNAEAWRQFDVAGLVGTDYSGSPVGIGSGVTLNAEEKENIKKSLIQNGSWIDDDECCGRLVYVNGRYVKDLSCSTDVAYNLSKEDFNSDSLSEEIIQNLNHLPDGFTDRLKANVPSGEKHFLTSLMKLSGPNHNVGEPTCQFSLNNQLGTACFVALNSVRAGAVAFVNIPDKDDSKPVIVINAITSDGSFESEDGKGVSIHPRTLVVVGEESSVPLIQTFVDLNQNDELKSVPKLVNGCTQIYVKKKGKVSHSYLEESGGMVIPGTEITQYEEGTKSPKVLESERSALKDTHFESIDVHLTGDDGSYEGAIMSLGGNGRSRISLSTTLLRPGTHSGIQGFSLSGGAQRADMRTNVHHIAQATSSNQNQRNMVGGMAKATFKGRIRVEQSAQQTDSEQLARTILLSDKAKVNAIPSLEIIADDVSCTHGATVSDLSEEELFYLRSRGIDKETSRNILMYGFVEEISSCVHKSVQGHKDDPNGLRSRVLRRLKNVIPNGEKTLVGDEFQSV